MQLPPSRSCTNGERAQGSSHLGHNILGERSPGNQLDGNPNWGDRSIDSCNPGDRDSCTPATMTTLALLTTTSVPPATTNPNDHYVSDHSFNNRYLGDYDNISFGPRSPDDLLPTRSKAATPTIREITDELDSPSFLQAVTALLKKSNTSSYIQRVSPTSTVEPHPPKASPTRNKRSPDLFEKMSTGRQIIPSRKRRFSGQPNKIRLAVTPKSGVEGEPGMIPNRINPLGEPLQARIQIWPNRGLKKSHQRTVKEIGQGSTRNIFKEITSCLFQHSSKH